MHTCKKPVHRKDTKDAENGKVKKSWRPWCLGGSIARTLRAVRPSKSSVFSVAIFFMIFFVRFVDFVADIETR